MEEVVEVLLLLAELRVVREELAVLALVMGVAVAVELMEVTVEVELVVTAGLEVGSLAAVVMEVMVTGSLLLLVLLLLVMLLPLLLVDCDSPEF